MALMWWPVAVAGLVCLATAVALALLLPMEHIRRQLRQIANSARLTRLPEYARMARARLLSTLVAIVLLAVLFGSTVVASARPSGWWWSTAASDPPQDIMLCVGQPVTDQLTGAFLTYFADQARTYSTQRIALTSPNRRVIPMTRDHQYAAGRLGDLAALSRDQGGRSTVTAASFSPAVSYIDYATSVEDVLALCMTGFPSFDAKSSHRRSLIYLGPGTIRDPNEAKPSLLTADQVTAMAANAGIQINTLNPVSREAGTLPAIAKASGGQYFSLEDRENQLTGDLDAVRRHPPAAATPAAPVATGWLGDAPALPLTIGVVASVLLCLSLVVLRR